MPTSFLELYLWFFIYSFMGWLWEEIICSVSQRKLVNRGFLNGPYCPIYGSGALLYIILMQFTTNPIELFFLGGTFACVLEYITSYTMEKIFHARWWDYSKQVCNINGRVCLSGFIAFGVFAVIMPYIHGFVSGLTGNIPTIILNTISLTLGILMLIDLFYTNKAMVKLNQSLKEYQKAIDRHREDLIGLIRRGRHHFAMRFMERQAEMHNILSLQQRRIINAFPDFTSVRYKEALDNLRSFYFLSMKQNKVEKKTAKTTKKAKRTAKKSTKKAAKTAKKAQKAARKSHHKNK